MGQGIWFGTENSVKLSIIGGAIGFFGTWCLILWDTGKVAFFLNDWFGISGGDTLPIPRKRSLDPNAAAVAGMVHGTSPTRPSNIVHPRAGFPASRLPGLARRTGDPHCRPGRPAFD